MVRKWIRGLMGWVWPPWGWEKPEIPAHCHNGIHDGGFAALNPDYDADRLRADFEMLEIFVARITEDAFERMTKVHLVAFGPNAKGRMKRAVKYCVPMCCPETNYQKGERLWGIWWVGPELLCKGDWPAGMLDDSMVVVFKNGELSRWYWAEDELSGMTRV